MTRQEIRIQAPVSSLREAEAVFAAGADMLYCGYLPRDWEDSFGDMETLSRRQGRAAHVTDEHELAAIAAFAHQHDLDSTLILNSHYTNAQEARVLALAEFWQRCGGAAIMLADLGILTALQQRGTSLTLCASVLTGVFNTATVRFLAALGVARVVLPRELAVDEVRRLIAAAPSVQYEMIAFHQRCPFIDGFCGFYHGCRIPPATPAEFSYGAAPGDGAVVEALDPAYEGHGCQLNWRIDRAPVRLPPWSDDQHPPCAACQLSELAKAGVHIAKIAGRGYPPGLIVRAVAFLSAARQLGGALQGPQRIRDLYRDTFGTACCKADCYYSHGGQEHEG